MMKNSLSCRKTWKKAKNRRKLFCVLIFGVMIFFPSCAKESYETSACLWPYAGSEVQKELETLAEDDYPALWEWLGRLAKLKEICESD